MGRGSEADAASWDACWIALAYWSNQARKNGGQLELDRGQTRQVTYLSQHLLLRLALAFQAIPLKSATEFGSG